MKQKLLNNIGIKILSVLAAIIIWILVVNVDDYMVTKAISNIPVTIINEDVITGLDKVYELEDDGTVRIIVKGRRSIVEGLVAEDFVATADLSKLSLTNAVQITVRPENAALANQLTISCPDNMISVALENRMEQQLPVNVLVQGEPAEGYAVVSKNSTPNMITVSGAESVVKRIKTVQVTVDVTGAKDDVSFVTQPVYLNTDGERVKTKKIKANVDAVDAVVEIERTKEIPVSVKTNGEVLAGYAVADVEYQPTSIEVAGREDALSRIDELKINDVNIAGLAENTEITIEVADYLPTGVQAIEGMEQIMIRVILEPVTTRDFALNTGDIEFLGKQDEYIYRISDITTEMEKSPMIQVKGIVSLVNALSLSDLKPKVDVTELKDGEYDLEITYMLPDKLTGSCTAKAHVVILPKAE
ncbi:MAG: hypothetical protein K2G89_06900 [Lachnospiraceae bacterium]|nr:hypothetical protein [Lachnospiraceae bacterium]